MKNKQIKRGDIFIVDLEPDRGSEIQKERPCLVVSPDEINAETNYVAILPITSGNHKYMFRIPCSIKNAKGVEKEGNIVVDQIRTVTKERMKKHICELDTKTLTKVLDTLQEMFAF